MFKIGIFTGVLGSGVTFAEVSIALDEVYPLSDSCALGVVNNVPPIFGVALFELLGVGLGIVTEGLPDGAAIDLLGFIFAALAFASAAFFFFFSSSIRFQSRYSNQTFRTLR